MSAPTPLRIEFDGRGTLRQFADDHGRDVGLRPRWVTWTTAAVYSLVIASVSGYRHVPFPWALGTFLLGLPVMVMFGIALSHVIAYGGLFRANAGMRYLNRHIDVAVKPVPEGRIALAIDANGAVLTMGPHQITADWSEVRLTPRGRGLVAWVARFEVEVPLSAFNEVSPSEFLDAAEAFRAGRSNAA